MNDENDKRTEEKVENDIEKINNKVNDIDENELNEETNSDFETNVLKDEAVENIEQNEKKDIEENIEYMDKVINNASSAKTGKNINKKKDNNLQGIAKYAPHIKRKIIIISTISVILAIIILIFIVMLLNKLNVNVYKNVYALDINFSGNNSNLVVERLKEESENIKKEYYLDIYENSEKIYTVKAQDIDFKIDVESTAQNIINFGRSKKLISNNIDIIGALFKKVNVDVIYSYDKLKLEETIKNIDLSIKNRFINDSYSLDEKKKKLIITRGKKGYTIVYDKESNNIIKSFEVANKNEKYTLNLIEKEPEELNLDEIYKKIKKEPKDGYIDLKSRPAKFISEIYGYDFNLNQAKEILDKPENKKNSKVIEIKLNILEPKVKLKDLTYNLYKEKIVDYTTYFDTSSPARVNNLNIALSYLNDKVIMPGETFSFNDAVGSITASQGYQNAATFKAGEVVMELGGGICQTTSTLYNVALMANLQIVERHQHGLPVGYVPPSRDATIYSPILDFKFKNTRNFPIKIVTSFNFGGSLNIGFYGTKEDTEYQVALDSRVISKVPVVTKYIYDSNLPKGTEMVVAEGSEGYVSEAYITKYLNGNLVSSNLLSKDTYSGQQRVIKVGTR